MKWDEFRSLLIGISPDTALGRIVSVRSENDKNVLKHFTKEQRRIRNEWRTRKAKSMNLEERDKALEIYKKAFIAIARN